MKKITGKEIRELREKAGLTQSDLAEILGYRREEINRFENGKRDIPLSVQIILSHIKLKKLDKTKSR